MLEVIKLRSVALPLSLNFVFNYCKVRQTRMMKKKKIYFLKQQKWATIFHTLSIKKLPFFFFWKDYEDYGREITVIRLTLKFIQN